MRSRLHHRVGLGALPATLAAALACAPADDATPVDLSADYDGLVLTDAPSAVAHLAWHTPRADCPLAYRVRIDETFPPGLAEFLHAQEEHSQSLLVLGWGLQSSRGSADSGSRDMSAEQWSEGPVPKDMPFAGQLMFRGPKSSGRELLREWAASAELVGPASPDAACYERTWDPVEDALALAFPQLPGRRARVGEVWRGARVEGRCNRSSCVDPDSGAGGAAAHERPCATMSWRERLDGVYTLAGPGGEATTVAQIAGFWSDGQPLDKGVWTERTVLVDTGHGRPLRAEVFVHHNFTGIERHVVIDAVDACPGGLVAAGWAAPAAIVDERAALTAALERATHRKR
ncbi:hypothetical protein [Nannocystis punicea]|uniref:Lipoprotein n=1 Tax=Nannocystis punicea TaxID=2995304 RepID=A0ABY7H622_9BACT|nr:hypothetical protein [Nannocystis poenicansa]WAS94657.1 hypothetical protein O0S08_00720 [Nannocystis poenicansa]